MGHPVLAGICTPRQWTNLGLKGGTGGGTGQIYLPRDFGQVKPCPRQFA